MQAVPGCVGELVGEGTHFVQVLAAPVTPAARTSTKQFKSVLTTVTSMSKRHHTSSQQTHTHTHTHTPTTTTAIPQHHCHHPKLQKEIKPHEAGGPDNTPDLFLKECAEDFAPVITTIFQLPSTQKTSQRTGISLMQTSPPVHRKRSTNKHTAEHYRPISSHFHQ